MFEQSLFQEVIEHLNFSDRIRMFLCALLVVIPGLIEGLMLMHLTEFKYKLVFVCAIQFGPFAELYRRTTSILVSKNVIDSFLNKFVMRTWAKLGFQSSMAIRAEQLMREARQAISCLESMCGYGVNQIIGLINTFVACMTVIIMKQQYTMAIFIVVSVLFVYFFVIKGMTSKLAADREKSRERFPEIDASLSQLSQHQQSKTGNPSGIVSLMSEYYDIRNAERQAYGKIEFVISVATNLGFLFLMFEDDEVKLLMLVVVLNQIKNSVMNFVWFMSWYDITVTQYDKFQNLWKGAKFEDDVEQVDLPPTIKISGVDVAMGDLNKLVHHHSLNMLEIVQGAKILLIGESGAGKSSFMNAFAGSTNGVSIVDGNGTSCIPASFRNCMLWFVQKTTDYTDTNGVILISLFKNVNDLAGEPDRECMDKALKVVGLQLFVENGGKEQLNAKEKLEKELEKEEQKLEGFVQPIDIEKQQLIDNHDNPKGVPLTFYQKMKKVIESFVKGDKEKTLRNIAKLRRELEFYERTQCSGYYKKLGSESGGEKQRLCLAAFVVYKLFLQQKENMTTYKVCILDEACKAIDPKTGYAMYDGLFTAFPEITFIVISHLERMDQFNWSHMLGVENGQISKLD